MVYSNFGSLFSHMKNNFFLFFYLKSYVLSRRVAHQSAVFQTFHCSQFFVQWEIIILYFLSWNFRCYWQNSQIKVQNFRLVTACTLKFPKFFMSLFESKIIFSLKLWIILHCHETWLFCTFWSKPLYALDKTSPAKHKFSDFWLFP